VLEEVSHAPHPRSGTSIRAAELRSGKASDQDGFTLLELMVAIAVLSILVLVALPSFRDLLVLQRIKGAAELVQTDLMLARSEAVRRNAPVFVSLNTGAQGCLGIGTSQCSCSTGSCNIKLTNFSPTSGAFPGIQLSSASATDLQFTAIRGAPNVINPAISLSSTDTTPTRQITVKLSMLGLTSACTPNGSVTGLSAC
jgi:type IV fimbrial biogenesis protein FimT